MGHISKALLLLTAYLALTLGQALNVCEYSLSSLLSTVIHHCFTLLVIVCDEANRQAENGVETAIKYLTQKGLASVNKKSMVTLTGEPNKAASDSEYLILLV